MHVLTLQCGRLLQLDRYCTLNDIQALATCLSACEVLQAEGPTPWPSKSPDLTPLDIFAWGFIKDVVYRRKVRYLADLTQRIIEAVELMTPHMLINTWQELEYRLGICQATTGAHIEVYGRA